MQSLNERRSILGRAMRDPDNWAVVIRYRSRHGNVTERTISPIRFTDTDRVLALCLGRESCRVFCLENILEATLQPSHEVVAPVAVVEVG
jgi:predicted DNA-binding transcriptional regulator YafY